MKKTLSLLLVLVLLMSSLSYAAVDQKAIGEQLKELGVIKGDGQGNLHEKDKLTREEAIATVIRLMGKEQEALATKLEPSFSDVPKQHWAKAYLAYAEIKNWTNGIGGGKFGLAQNVTTQQYVTYMLRVLGYGDTPYDKSMIEAAKLGLLDDVVATKASDFITRGDVFVVMDNTLNTKLKGEERELVYKLGLKEKSEDDSQEQPNTQPKPEQQPDSNRQPESDAKPLSRYVKSVKTNGLKQIIVEYNEEVKKAGDEDNYILDGDGKDTAKIDKNSFFDLSEDKKTVTITLSKAAKQQEKVDLVITGLLPKREKIEDVEFFDNEPPSIESVKVVGERVIKLTFSELMDSSLTKTDNYVVKNSKGSKVYVKEVTEADHGKSALVEMYSDLTSPVEITVNDVRDFFGFKPQSDGATFNLVFEKDDDAPEMIDFKNASLNGVTLVFDEDIKFDGTPKDVYHTNQGNKASSVKVDGDKLIIKFADGNELPPGTAYIYIADETISDYWGNENDGKMVCEVSVEVDKTKPEVVSTEVESQKEVVVTYSEPIKKTSKFKLTLEKKGKKVSNTISSSIDDEELTVNFSEALYGDYKLTIKGIADEYDNVAETEKVSFTAEDKTAPDPDRFKATAYEIGEELQQIIVDFGEEMNERDITNKGNYQIDNKFLEDLDDVDISAIDENTSVRITIPEGEYDIKSSKLSAGNRLLEVGRMADASGNRMADYSVTLDIKNGDEDEIKIKEVQLVAPKRVEFVIDDVLERTTFEQFVVYESGERMSVAGNDINTNKDGDSVVVIELVDDVATDPEAEGLTYVVRSSSDLKDDGFEPSYNRFGQKLGSAGGDVIDKCSPVVDKVVFVDESVIKVYFSEKLDGNYISNKGHNGFSVSDGTLEDATLDDSDSKIIVITGKDFNRNTNVYYDESDIYDRQGNELKSFDHTEKLSVE